MDRAIGRLCGSGIVRWATAVEADDPLPLLPALWGLRRVWLVFGSWVLLPQLILFVAAAMNGALEPKNWAYMAINLTCSVSVTLSMSSIFTSNRSRIEHERWMADLERRYLR